MLLAVFHNALLTTYCTLVVFGGVVYGLTVMLLAVFHNALLTTYCTLVVFGGVG